MTELDERLKEFLDAERAARAEGITLPEVYRLVKDVANGQLETNSKLAAHISEDERRFESGDERAKRHWKEIKRNHAAARPTMPSLGPDDSGSIEVGAFGAKASFRGIVPVRIALALFIVACLMFAGYMT